MWERFRASEAPAMITVDSNKDGYTRNSVRVEDDGKVSIYDKSCTDPTLNGRYAFVHLDVDFIGGEKVAIGEFLLANPSPDSRCPRWRRLS
jgi:hypothetical protein